MKIALTADLQLSEQARYSHRTEEGITSRLRDQVACVEWITYTAIEQGCTHFAALGDIFDQRNAVTAPVLDQAGRAFRHVNESFEWCALLVGNHDAPLRTPALTSLRALDGLLHIIDAPKTVGELAFVPWIDDPDDYRAAIGKVAEGKGRYLLSHMMVQGAVPMAKGLPIAGLRPKRWDMIFLGDVHEPVALDPNIQYLSAPMQHHYGDAGGERGFWILDTDDGSYEFFENDVSPRFHILDSVDTSEVREGDFVRVQTEAAEVEASIIGAAGKITDWVEARPVELDDAPPRLDVGTSQGHREILERYVGYQLEGEEHETLVDTGMALLREVT